MGKELGKVAGFGAGLFVFCGLEVIDDRTET
jgi:hypothetical protein